MTHRGPFQPLLFCDSVIPLCPAKLNLGLIHTCVSLYKIRGLPLLEDKYVYNRSVLQKYYVVHHSLTSLIDSSAIQMPRPKGFYFPAISAAGSPAMCFWLTSSEFSWPW